MRNPLSDVIQTIVSKGNNDHAAAIAKANQIQQEAAERAALVTRLGELDVQLAKAEELVKTIPAGLRALAEGARERGLVNLSAEAATYGCPATLSHVDDILRADWILAHEAEIIDAARELSVRRIERERAELKGGSKGGFLQALGLR